MEDDVRCDPSLLQRLSRLPRHFGSPLPMWRTGPDGGKYNENNGGRRVRKHNVIDSNICHPTVNNDDLSHRKQRRNDEIGDCDPKENLEAFSE